MLFAAACSLSTGNGAYAKGLGFVAFCLCTLKPHCRLTTAIPPTHTHAPRTRARAKALSLGPRQPRQARTQGGIQNPNPGWTVACNENPNLTCIGIWVVVLALVVNAKQGTQNHAVKAREDQAASDLAMLPHADNARLSLVASTCTTQPRAPRSTKQNLRPTWTLPTSPQQALAAALQTKGQTQSR